MTARIKTIDLFADTLPLSFTDEGQGRTYLVIHGGSGPASVRSFAEAFIGEGGRVIVPIHPGFDNRPRPEWFSRSSDLATAYLALVQDLGLSNVTVIGHSFGGWIAAEMATRRSPRISAFVLMNAVGIDPGSPHEPIVNPMDLEPEERVRRAFFDRKYAVTPPTPDAMAIMRSNYDVLRVYSGRNYMYDPSLRSRLSLIRTPLLLVWGEADGIVDPEYGRRYAENVPGSQFESIADAGHSPHVENHEMVFRLIKKFEGQALS